MRAKINEIDNQKYIQSINETKIWFFKKINKIDKPLANMTKMSRGRPKLVKSETKNGR
jgi:hypothetical protein